MDQLTAALLDLLTELEPEGIPLTLGGGFGLFLKRRHLAETKQRTLFTRLPDPRSTNDLDLFIRVEVLADLGRTTAIAGAIRKLGYRSVESARFMQWAREVVIAGIPQKVKIDLLVGPLGGREAALKADDRRARPRGKVELHARRTEEALCVDEAIVEIPVSGRRSDGMEARARVCVPRAFPY